MRNNKFQFFDSKKSVAIAYNNKLNTYDGSNLLNVKPITQRVDMVGGVTSAQNVVWNQDNSAVTITHNLNCIPVVACYDSLNNQIQPDIQILDNSSFSIDFQNNETGNEYYCIISYGTEYGDPAAITTALTSYVQQAADAATSASNAASEAADAALQASVSQSKVQTFHNTIVNSYSQVIMNACTNLGIVWGTNQVSIMWTDPEDTMVNGVKFAKWQKTELWRYPSDSQYPEYPGMPGAVLIAKTEMGTEHLKNAYSTTPFIDDTVQPNTPYAYALFSYTQGGVVNQLDANRYPINTSWNAQFLHMFSQAGTLLNYVSIGDLFSFEHSEYGTVPVRLMGYDDVLPWDTDVYSHAAVFQAVDCIYAPNYNYGASQFDAPQYRYAITADIIAIGGKSYYTFDGVSTYTKLVEGVDYQVRDSIPLNTWYEQNPCTDNSQYGNNRWSQSDLREYLNSDGFAGTWHQNKNIWEYQNQYKNRNGFLYGMQSSLKNILVPIRRRLALANKFGAGYQQVQDKIFLPTIYEQFGNTNNGVTEGVKRWKWYLDNNTNQARKKMLNGTFTIHWCSSANTGISRFVYFVGTDGLQNGYNAFNSLGVAPAYAL